MNKAHVKAQMGGAPAAVEAYRNAPTPNVIVLETMGDRSQVLGALDLLASAEPLGYDPGGIGVPGWDGPSSPAFSVLRLDPWRVRVLTGEPPQSPVNAAELADSSR